MIREERGRPNWLRALISDRTGRHSRAVLMEGAVQHPDPMEVGEYLRLFLRFGAQCSSWSARRDCEHRGRSETCLEDSPRGEPWATTSRSISTPKGASPSPTSRVVVGIGSAGHRSSGGSVAGVQHSGPPEQTDADLKRILARADVWRDCPVSQDRLLTVNAIAMRYRGAVTVDSCLSRGQGAIPRGPRVGAEEITVEAVRDIVNSLSSEEQRHPSVPCEDVVDQCADIALGARSRQLPLVRPNGVDECSEVGSGPVVQVQSGCVPFRPDGKGRGARAGFGR
jgi:hypothetical protein